MLLLGCPLDTPADDDAQERPDTAETPDDDTDAASPSARLDALEARHDALEARHDAMEARHDAETDALEERIATLEAELEDARAAAEAHAAALDAATARLDAMETAQASVVALLPLADVLAIDSAGDVVFDGVNVYIRSGSGATDGAPNGKGNLILGYAEGTGARSGSHTLVAGTGLDWQARWGIAVGTDSVLTADGGAFVGGSGHTVSGRGGVAVGGAQNTVTHTGAVLAAGARRASEVDCGFRASGSSSGSGC
jgi:BMFP domain-containing protein YqiC